MAFPFSNTSPLLMLYSPYLLYSLIIWGAGEINQRLHVHIVWTVTIANGSMSSCCYCLWWCLCFVLATSGPTTVTLSSRVCGAVWLTGWFVFPGFVLCMAVSKSRSANDLSRVGLASQETLSDFDKLNASWYKSGRFPSSQTTTFICPTAPAVVWSWAAAAG